MTYTEELNKIYIKIDQLGQRGKDATFDYYIYIDDIVNKSKYSLLKDVMNRYYKIYPDNYLSVDDFKRKAFQ
jgi:hypothetical protein